MIHLSRRDRAAPSGSGATDPAAPPAETAPPPAGTPPPGGEPGTDAPGGGGPGSAPPGGAPPGGAAPGAEAGRRRRRRLLAGGAVLTVVVVVAALLFAGRSSRTPAGPPVTAPPARVTPGAQPTFGVYPGDGTALQEVDQYQALSKVLGYPIPNVVLMTDTRSEDAFRGSVFGHFVQAGGWKDLGRTKPTVVVSVPLAFGGFTPTQAVAHDGLSMAAAGKYDGDYRYLAESMVSAGYGAGVIRLGWEFDGSWMPWTAQGNASAYVAAFRHVHDVFAAVSSRFRFDWTSAGGYELAPRAGTYQWQGAMDWTRAYPGDDYVDIVGVDLYDESQGLDYDQATRTWKDPEAAWAYESTPLALVRDFAIDHGKQVSYPEWGLSDGGSLVPRDNGGDNPAFVRGMAAWFADLPGKGPGSLAYQAYFQGTTQQDGVHAIERFPRAYQLFKSLFGA